MKIRIAAALLAGMAALVSLSAAAEGCNASATDGACLAGLAPRPVASAVSPAVGVGYQLAPVGMKQGDTDALLAVGAAPLGTATGGPGAIVRANGGWASLLQSSPDSPLTWVFILGFLAFVVLRRTRARPML